MTHWISFSASAHNSDQNRWLMAIFLLGALLLAAALCLPGLGERPLYSAGEVRCALIAQEMLESGDWVQPRLNTVRYYEKPPLMYWSIATAYWGFGVNEFASRLPAALAYLGTVIVVFLLGLELLGPCGAVYSGFVFLTALSSFHFGRFVSTDTVLTFFLTLSLLGLVKAVRSETTASAGSLRVLVGPLLFWLGMALAGLTKGLIGLFFPGATAAAWALVSCIPGTLRQLRPKLGILVIAGVFLPWHLLMAWRDPSFVPFYVLNEHVYRFLNVREPIDYEPLSVPGFFLSTALWFFPWLLFLPSAFVWSRHQHHLALPLIFAAVVLGFFLLVRCRLEYYGQPVYPALAVVVAGYWLSFHSGQKRWLGLGLPALAMVFLGMAASYLTFLKPDINETITSKVSTVNGYYREYFAKHPHVGFFFAQKALELGKPLALSWLCLGLAGFWAARSRRFGAAFWLWVLLLIPAAFGFNRIILLVAEDRSQRTAAQIVQANWEEGASLVTAGTFEDVGGVAFYTKRNPKMLDAHNGDLLFGYKKGDPRIFF